jgi:hypothetical protein
MPRLFRIGRARRYRRTHRTASVGLTIGALVLGGATVFIAASGHGSTQAAQSAAFSAGFGGHHSRGESGRNQGSSPSASSSSQLAGTNQQTFTQAGQHGGRVDVQRGTVVFVSQHSLVVRSGRRGRHRWVLTANTQFDNAADLTADPTASPSPTPSASPTASTETVTVSVPETDFSVTVTITGDTATITQVTTTATSTASPSPDPTTTDSDATSVAKGDLAVVIGARSHGVLHADIVLYVVPSDPSPSPSASASTSASPSPSPSPTPSVSDLPAPIASLIP